MSVRAVLLLGVLVMSACAPEQPEVSTLGEAQVETSPDTTQEVNTAQQTEDEPQTDQPLEQADSCDWGSPPLTPGSAPASPGGQERELHTVIIGAWQHTHFDNGNGFEAIEDEDIRFVFPSSTNMRYCQHVPGITEYAENATEIIWQEHKIVLPNGNTLYEVISWDDDTMVWANAMIDSRYLLKRR